MAKFIAEAAEAALRSAIQAIEQQSSAEVVVAVRPRLRRWLVPHIAIGATLLIAVLAFVLFSDDYEFELWSIALAPVLAGFAGGLLVEAVPPLDRALVPARVRDALVRDAARAAFVELGVHATRGRTGVLVFAAVRERRAMLVGDLEVVAKIGDGLAGHEAALTAALPSGGEALASAVARLAGPFSAALPRASADVNELPDTVHVRRARGFRRSVR